MRGERSAPALVAVEGLRPEARVPRGRLRSHRSLTLTLGAGASGVSNRSHLNLLLGVWQLLSEVMDLI